MARRKFTAGCLFAGMGGICQGLKQAGIRTLWANEQDKHAAATFSANHPKVAMHTKSIEELSVLGDNLAPVDIIAAGFPCQSFSQAGRRRGFADERGELFLHIPRLVGEFGAQRPPILLLENVPNLLNGEGGRWIERIWREIQRADYWFNSDNCQVLDSAKVTDVPQRRERLFMVAASMESFDCNSFQFPPEIDEVRPLSQFIDKSRKKPDDHYLPSDNRFCKILAKKIEEGNKSNVYQLRRYYARENEGVCPPLTANMGGGGHNVPFVKDKWGIRRLAVQECAALQGFGPDYAFAEGLLDKERYQQLGNTVTVPVVEHLGRECAKMLATQQET